MDTAINGYYKLSWRERIGFCSGDLAENPCMPMIIEHLDTDEEYVASVRYVRNVCSGR